MRLRCKIDYLKAEAEYDKYQRLLDAGTLPVEGKFLKAIKKAKLLEKAEISSSPIRRSPN